MKTLTLLSVLATLMMTSTSSAILNDGVPSDNQLTAAAKSDGADVIGEGLDSGGLCPCNTFGGSLTNNAQMLPAGTAAAPGSAPSNTVE